MSDERMYIFVDDGTLREYNTEFDVTIHCESKEDHDKVVEILTSMQKLRDVIDFKEAAKALKNYCAQKDCAGCFFNSTNTGWCRIGEKAPCAWNL